MSKARGGVELRTYAEALRIARAAGTDAGNRRMQREGRDRWNDADWDHAAEVTNGILLDTGWLADGEVRP